MEILLVFYRTIIFYVIILVILRLMGKREIAQLSVQDLVVSILMAELVAISIENYKDSIYITIVPIILIFGLEMFTTFLSIKSSKFRTLVEGKPSLVINNGEVCFKELVRQRYSLENLLSALRQNNIKDIKDVEYAILENNGELSIFKYNIFKTKSDFPFAVILDGKIEKDTLKYLHKSCAWLMGILNEKKVNLEDIFYAFYKGKELYIIKKSF